jgi:hypothetical protein
LDLSLGNSSSKSINNAQTYGNHHTSNVANHASDQSNWQNGGNINKPKVYQLIYKIVNYFLFNEIFTYVIFKHFFFYLLVDFSFSL